MTTNTVDETCEMDLALTRIESEDDVQSLLLEMQECMAIAVSAIFKLGAIVRRLEALNFDLNSIRIPNVDYFRRIAYGTMLPEVFVNLAGRPLLMRRVANLPLPDQKHVVEGKPLKVMIRGGDFIQMSVTDMTRDQVNQVFATDHIRSDSQQVAWLVGRSETVARKPGEIIVMVDRRRKGIVVGDTFISVSDLSKYLSDLMKK